MKKVPEKGDYVHIDFDPQAGHEQAGSRFGLVLTSVDFNRVTGFAWVAPITTKVKGYPFEVLIPPGERCNGVVLVDQTKSLDWKARNLEVKGKASDSVVEDACALVAAILEG
ncbi:MAG: type II toxin-antitoxin system PemK/MazF family toxin [Deltaproteobacteria bacterium]|nr:type II toxin-antitoxin system PemK/MazF family toxin [Deltaproteobacteria bacterium]